MENEYTRIAQSLDAYKEVLATKSSVYNKMLVAYDEVSGSIEVTALSLTPVDFNITLYSSNLLEFSKLIEHYLRSSLIASITLEGAVLNPGSNGYTVDIRGVFK